MARKGNRQTGKFNIQEGMVLSMPDLKFIHPRGPKIQAHEHPWLIVNIYRDYIEIVMCTTLSSNNENKHRFNQLYHDNKTDILHPCPPMDRPEIRTSGVSLDTAILLPKKELFSHPIYIWNENTPKINFTTDRLKSLCLCKSDLKNIRNELVEYQLNHKGSVYDPFDCKQQEDYLLNLEDGYHVPKGFTKQAYEKQFGWEHIKEADKLAVYPFEDQMHDYEKADPELLKIARQKKYNSKPRQSKQPQVNQKLPEEDRIKQAEELLNYVMTKSPNTNTGYEYDE